MLMAIDFFCSSGYEKNNETKFLNVDVSKLPKESLFEEFGITKNQDNLVFVGCSPCQYYSNIRTNKSKSENTKLLLEDFQDFDFLNLLFS